VPRRPWGLVAAGVLVLLAGCVGGGAAPETAPAPSRTAAASCDRQVPSPIPDLRFINRLDEPRSLTVTVVPKNGSTPIIDETVTLDASADVDRVDVVDESAAYRITATLPDNTSASTVMEIEPGDRYGIVTITVQADRVLIERLGVHPEPTPTPCPA